MIAGVKNDNKVFIINESNQQMYEKNPTGKKLYTDANGLPTLNLNDAKEYKWMHDLLDLMNNSTTIISVCPCY